MTRMRLFLAAWALAVAGFACLALGYVDRADAFWQTRGSNYNIAISGSPPAYIGPGDLTSNWIGFYSVRAFTTAKANAGATTVAIMDVTGNNTATSCSIFLKGTGTGDADLTTAGAGGVGNQCPLGVTTFCTVTNAGGCVVHKWYDQTANANNVTGNGTNDPALSFSCNGSLICVTSASSLFNVLTISSYTPLSVYGVAKRTSGTGFGSILDTFGSNGIQLYFNNSANHWMLGGSVSSIFPVANDNAWHIAAGINGTSGIINIDGTETGPTNVGSTGATTKLAILQGASGGSTWAGTIEETGLTTSAFSSGDRTALCHNASGYYTIASC